MNSQSSSAEKTRRVTVYYDGACPSCIDDRCWYEKHAGKEAVQWCDISGQDKMLKQKGIDPYEAMTILHIETANGKIINDIDAYRRLFQNIW